MLCTLPLQFLNNPLVNADIWLQDSISDSLHVMHFPYNICVTNTMCYT